MSGALIDKLPLPYLPAHPAYIMGRKHPIKHDATSITSWHDIGWVTRVEPALLNTTTGGTPYELHRTLLVMAANPLVKMRNSCA